MKAVFITFILIITANAQAGCLDHWTEATEMDRKKLSPIAQPQDKTDSVFDEVRDQFLGLGESVGRLLERSSVSPRVRFQDRIIRLMKGQATPADREILRTEYSDLYNPTPKKIFDKKLKNLFSHEENLCLSGDDLFGKREEPFDDSSYILKESEFYSELTRR